MSPSLDSLAALDVGDLFDEDLVRQARSLLRSGALLRCGVKPEDNTIWAVIWDGKNLMPRFIIRNQQVFLGCDCKQIKHEDACPHVVALLLTWVENRELFRQDDALPSQSLQPAAGLEPEPAQAEPVLPSLEEMTRDYRELLQSLTVTQMRNLAAQRGVRLSGLRREGILEMLAFGLRQPENTAQAVGRLSAPGRLTLDLLLLLTGEMRSFALSQFYKRTDPILSGHKPGARTAECLEELQAAALIFNLHGNWQFPLAIRHLQWGSPDLVAAYTGQMGRVEAAEPFGFSRLALWLTLLSQSGQLECPPPVKSDGGGWPPSKEAQRNVQEAFLPPFPAYLTPESLRRAAAATGQPADKVDFTAVLLDQAHFWAHGLPQKLGPAYTSWLQRPVDQQGRALLIQARRLESPAELERARQAGNFWIIRNPRNFSSYRKFMQNLAAGKDLLFKVLSRLPVGVWLDVESLLKLLYHLLPDPLIGQGYPNSIWLEQGSLRINPAQYDPWRQTYGLFYLMTLIGPCHWLGVCDLNTLDGQVAAFRISDFGAYLLGRGEHYEQAESPAGTASLAFTPDGRLELDPGRASGETIGLVMLIGNPETNKASRSDRKGVPVRQVLTYRLYMEGLGRAFAAGWSWPKIQAVLEGAAGTAMPPGLAAQIRDTWERYGRLHLYPDLALIQFADDFCLPELLTGTRLGQYMLYQFSPRLIAVRPDNVEALVRELQEKGYTPRVTSGIASRVEEEGQAHG